MKTYSRLGAGGERQEGNDVLHLGCCCLLRFGRKVAVVGSKRDVV